MHRNYMKIALETLPVASCHCHLQLKVFLYCCLAAFVFPATGSIFANILIGPVKSYRQVSILNRVKAKVWKYKYNKITCKNGENPPLDTSRAHRRSSYICAVSQWNTRAWVFGDWQSKRVSIVCSLNRGYSWWAFRVSSS